MSTLGGSRGERNAKPKFSALDINRMYKNSRGESAEPSAQKNQVPRKHGMQSLGKVPSARRPPANLPSLKAETINSPIINNNLLTSSTGQEVSTTLSGGQGTTTSTGILNQQLLTAALLKNSNKSILGNINNNNNNINTNNNNSNNSNNASVIGIGSKLINNSSTLGSGGGAVGGVQQLRNSSVSNHANHQQPQHSPITWSAVTTGNDISGNSSKGSGGKASVPPLYQSPQFQYEFPTLDGTVGGGGSGGGSSHKKEHHQQQQQQHNIQQNQQQNHQNYHQAHQRDYPQLGRNPTQDPRHDAHNYKDGNDVGGGGGSDQDRDFNEVSLRPQTDAAAWLLQQEKAAKGAAENASNQQGQAPQGSSSGGAAVPLPILALMPSFMQRGAPLPAGSSGGIGITRSLTPPNYQNGIGGKEISLMSNTTSQRLQRPLPQNANSQDYRANSPAVSNFRAATTIPKRPPQLTTPPLGAQTANGGGSSGGSMRKDKEFIVEPEVAQMQRPIIREEDLERLNAIAKDDSWTKQDEIDYTKKLTFSDDESPDEPAQERSVVFNKSGSRESTAGNAGDQRKGSNASGTASSGGWIRGKEQQRDSTEREISNERGEDVRQQNGHRNNTSGAITLDASVYERHKQRKEEEERRENERKQAAAKKLQALEMKMNSKKQESIGVSSVVDVSNEQPTPPTSIGGGSDDDYHSQQQLQFKRGVVSSGRVLDYERGSGRYETPRDTRAGGDYIRNDRNLGGTATTGTTGASKAVFSAHFQSNLPPRFQRQQQMQSHQGSTSSIGGSGGSNSSVNNNNSNARSIISPNVGGLEKSASASATYDSGRYIQKGAPSAPRSISGRSDYRENYSRNTTGYTRNRNDSEREDERYHGNHYGRGLNQNQLSRSISDTSQRKTSVSSNDDSIKYGVNDVSKEFGSGVGLVSSWAEETDAEMKRQREESFSSSHSHDSMQIKILQRPHPQKSLSEEESTQKSHQSSSQQNQRRTENDQTQFVPTQILRRSESNDDKSHLHNQNISNCNDSAKVQDEKSALHLKQQEISSVADSQIKRKESESSSSGIGNSGRKELNAGAGTATDEKRDDSRAGSNQSHLQRDPKRSSPRSSGGRDQGRDQGRDREREERERDRKLRSTHTHNFGSGSYRGGRDNWNSRGGGAIRNSRYFGANDQPFPSESEHSESVDEDGYGGSSGVRRSDRSPKVPRKDQTNRRNGSDADGFAPRGEPSRRGRGGSHSERGSSSSYRRNNDGRFSSGSGNQTRQYGRQTYDDRKDHKHGSESEQTGNMPETDKTKQNQIALSAGLSKVKGTSVSPDEKSNTAGLQSAKQSSPLGQDGKKLNDSDKKVTSNTSLKLFGANTVASGSTGHVRKESTSSSKNDDTLGAAQSDRERKSSSKEKEITTNSGSIQQRNNSSGQSSGQRNNSIVGSSQIKKQDLPMASMPTTQSSSPAVTATSTTITTKSLQQQTITKPPPGLGGTTLKSMTTTSNVNSASATITSQSLQQQQQQQQQHQQQKQTTTDLQKNKSDTNSISSMNRQQHCSIVETDKGKHSVNSVGLDKSPVSNNGLMLDGTPVNTIIFENTNYKQQAHAVVTTSATQLKRTPDSLVSATVSNVTVGVNVSAVDTLSNALSQMSFAKGNDSVTSTGVANVANDYEKDMKLGFSFGDTSDSYTNSNKVNSNETESIKPIVTSQQATSVGQQQQQAQNIISTAELNMKIASVKKVWENVSPMATDTSTSLQQQSQQQNQQQIEVVDASGHMSAASFVAAAAAVAASQQQHQQQQHMPHYAVTAVHMQQHHSLSSPGPVQSAYGSHGSPFDASQLEQQFGQNVVGDDSSVVGYVSPQQQQSASQQQQQQVLKHDSVKQQQVSAAAKQLQQHHSSSMGISPPPSLQQPQQQQQQHQQSAAQQIHAAPQTFYQASPQFTGIPTIPSPPAVVFNSSQMPPPPSQGGLYAPFHSLDHSSRSQYSAAAAHSFPGHYGAAAASVAAAGGPFNAYAMQTAPNMATAPTPELYSNLTSQFRMSGGPSPFGNPNSQQLSNPNAAAVAIISSNSNSLMSSVGSVKPPPSSQQLGTIGSKGAGGGGPYAAAAAAQQYMNLYAGPPPQHQGGPPGPPGAHQLQSNSYYSNSAGGPNGPTFYGGPPPPQGAGAGAQNYGLAAAAAAAAGLYGSHAGHQGGPPGSNGPGPQGPPGPQSQHTMGNFNTQFLNSPLLTAAAINQFRGGPTQQAAAAAYMKSNQGQNHLQDSMGRQLKSPLGADVSLNLAKQVQSQPSPPHHKNYGSWDLQNQVLQQQSQQQQQQAAAQRVSGNASGNSQNMNSGQRSTNGPPSSQSNQGRYPTPIQRPTNYPQHPQGGGVGPQSQQQQQQQQQSQQGQRPPNMRQGGGNGTQSGPGGPNNNGNGGGGPGGPNNVGNNGTGNQQQQINKPYYTNNANAGANRGN